MLIIATNNNKKITWLALSSIFILTLALILSSQASWANETQPTSFSSNANTLGFEANNDAEFLNVEQAYQLNLDFQTNENGSLTQPVLIWNALPGYYLYKHGFKQYIHDAITSDNEQQITGDIPEGKLTTDEYFGEVETYYHQVVIPLNIQSSEETLYIRAQSQGCADAGLCYPPHDVYAKVNINTQHVELISQDEYQVNSTNDITPPPLPAFQTTFMIALLSAFLGGLILNLMPCVLPVLSIKLLQIQQSGRHVRLHGIAYMAGVVLSFLAIAATLIAVRNAGHAVGWGFQLQQPWVVALLVFLFFILALSLSGYFELGSRLMGLGQSQHGQNQASANKISSAFSTGILAVIVATPCTAPFMGTALGYALTQPNMNALFIFASLGFGMALPLTAITFIPSLHKFMPKPGMWMVRLKEFFAFPLYITCVWLLWVLTNQTSTTSLALVLLGLISIAFTIWCFKTQVNTFKVLGIASLIAVATGIFTGDTLNTQAQKINDEHLAYSAKGLAELREQGTPVFIDLTADWCITCLANKKSTLAKPKIQQAFKEAGITYMEGDWTNFNPEITALLERYQRSGIPLYLLYPPRANAEARILPQILTPNIVIEAINNNQ